MPLGLNFQANVDLTSFNKAISSMVEGLNVAQKRITEITTQVGPQAEKIFKGFKIDPTGVTSPLNSVLGTLSQVGKALDTINEKSGKLKWSSAFEMDRDVKQASTSLNSLVRTLMEAADAMTQVGTRMQSTRLLNRSVIDEGGKSLRDLTKDVKELERAYSQAQRALQKDPGNLGLKDELQVIRSLIRGAESDVSMLQQRIRQTQSVGGILQAEAQGIKRYAASVLESYGSILELGKRGQAAPKPITYTEPTRAAVLPSLAQQTGQTYVEAFARSLFTTTETLHSTLNNALRDMAAKLKFGVDLSGEGVSATATKEITDKYINRLRAASKAINAIVDSPEATKAMLEMGEGTRPPEDLIRKIGSRLDKMSQYLWKQVDEYASKMGEGSSASAGVTGKIPIEQTRAEILPKVAQLTAEINQLEAAGLKTQDLRIVKLREERQQLEATLKYAETHGGLTGVSTAHRTGLDLTVGLSGRTTRQRGSGIDESVYEKTLGLDSRILADETSITNTVIQRTAVSEGALSGLQRTASVVEHLRNLWVGMGAEPGKELVSMLKAAAQLESLIGRSTQIGAFDPEIMKVISSLPIAIGKTTGYIGREIPNTISEASMLLQGTHQGLSGLPGAAPFKEQMDGLTSLDKQLRGISYKNIETQIEKVKTILGEALTDPKTKLPELYKALGHLNTLLESTANVATSVRERASTMFDSVNLGPILEKFGQLESLWSSPLKGKSLSAELDTQMTSFFSSFKEEGAQKPLRDILTLWKEVYKVVQMYHSEVASATKATEFYGTQFRSLSSITQEQDKVVGRTAAIPAHTKGFPKAFADNIREATGTNITEKVIVPVKLDAAASLKELPEGFAKNLDPITRVLTEMAHKFGFNISKELSSATTFGDLEKIFTSMEQRVLRPVGQKFQGAFEQASHGLNLGFEGAKAPLMILNSLSEAFMKVIFHARDLGSVGVNAAGILGGSQRLSLLTNEAISGTLPREVTAEFNAMRQAIESATVVVEARHLPALQLVLDTVKKLEMTTREFAGGSLYRAPRGLTPEWLTEKLGIRTGAEPFAFGGFGLEESLTAYTPVGGQKISAMGRYFRKVGEEIEEYFQMIGAQLKPTAAQAAFPGNLEVVDIGLRKIQGGVVKSLEYTIDQLARHEMPVQMFEPTITEYFPKLIERLGIAKQAAGAPGHRPDVAALDLTLGNTKRQLEVVQALYRELFAIVKSGKPITDEVFQSMEAKAKRLSNTFKRDLIVDVDTLLNKLRQYIRFGEAVPEVVQQALKLPAKTGGVRSGIFELLTGTPTGAPGEKPFLETLQPEALLRLEHGLSTAKADAIANPRLPEKVLNGILWKIEKAQGLLATRITSMPESAWPKGLYEQLSPEFQKTVGRGLPGATKEKASLGDLSELAAEAQAQAEKMEQAERSIPKKINEVTPLKVAALKNQRKEMVDQIQQTKKVVNEEAEQVQPTKKVKTPKKTAFEEHENAEARAADRKDSKTVEEAVESLFGTPEGTGTGGTVKGRNKYQTGPNSMVDVTNQSLSLKNRLAELSEQFNIFGHAVSSTGVPVNTFMQGMTSITQMINGVIKEMATMGGLAPTFDTMVEKFNAESTRPHPKTQAAGLPLAFTANLLDAAPDISVPTPVKTIRTHWTEMEDLRKEIDENRVAYLAARQGLTTDEGAGVGAQSPMHQVLENTQARHIELTDRLKVKRQEMIATMDVLLSKENLAQDIYNREISTIEQLGYKYQILKAGAETGTGAIASRTAHLEPLQQAETIAREALVSNAWNRPGSLGETANPSSPFLNLEQPAMSPVDVMRKIFSPAASGEDPFAHQKRNIQTFAEIFGENAQKIAEIYAKLNESLRLGIKFPEFDKTFGERTSKMAKELETMDAYLQKHGISQAADADRVALNDVLQKETEDFLSSGLFPAIEQTYRKISNEAKVLREIQVGQDFVAKIKKSTEAVAGMQTELSALTKTLEKFKAQGMGVQFKIPAYEYSQEKIHEAQKMLFQAQRGGAPASELKGLADTIAETQAASKNMLSVWDRLTNTIKTSRNSMAELFMYQVRWYSSMMVFFAIFNRISELFSNMVHAQFEIERATINMREHTGEVVANYERLQSIARTAIFEGMEKWGYTAKDASEALYQLGSAGLTAKEALAALNPSLAMAMGTTADMRESVKTLAGLYNVLSSSMTPLDRLSQSIGLSTAAEANALSDAAQKGATFRHIADTLTMVFRDHQVEMGELNKGYQFAISSSDLAGLSFEQLSAILAVLNDNMIKSSRAGRGVNQAIAQLAKDPYAVFGSFKQMALAMEDSIRASDKGAEKWQRVQDILSNWDYSKLKDKNMFEAFGELSKMINATGLDIGTLSRILENFGILGGRAVAPMLKNWFDIERESIRLSISAADSSEMMATRMSNTVEKGLLKVSAYFQSAFYDVISITGVFSKAVLGSFAQIGESASGLGKSISASLPAWSTGGGFTGGFIEGALKVAPTVLTLASAFWLLGGAVPKIGAIFPAIGAHVLSVGTKIGALTTVLYQAASGTVALGTAAQAADVALSFSGIGKFLLGIGVVIGTFALMTGVFKRFFESSEEAHAAAEQSVANYNAELAKGIQKQREAWTQATYINQTRTALLNLTAEMSDNAKVTEEVYQRYRLYAVSLGATTEVEKQRFANIGELRKSLTTLQGSEEGVLKASRERAFFAVNSIQAEKLYVKAVEDTIAVIQKLRQELETVNRLKEVAAKGTVILPSSPWAPEGLYGPPDSAAVNKLTYTEKALKAEEEARIEELRQLGRQRLMRATVDVFPPGVIASIKEKGEKDGAEGEKAALEAFDKGMQDALKNVGSREGLAALIFPSIKGDTKLAGEQLDNLLAEMKNKGPLFSKYMASMATVTGIPLGAQTQAQAMQKTFDAHNSAMQNNIASKEKLIQIENDRLVQIQKAKIVDMDEVESIMSRTAALSAEAIQLEKTKAAQERKFQLDKLSTSSPLYNAEAAKVETEHRKKNLELEDKALKQRNENQRMYEQMLTVWYKQTLPQIREKGQSLTTGPSGALEVVKPGAAETTEQMIDALKPKVRVTKEKFQEIVNELKQQMTQFGFGPEVAKIFMALIAHESNYVETAIGIQTDYGKARGLLQILPSNLTAMGVKESDFYDVRKNLNAGVKMLQGLDSRFNLDLRNFAAKSPQEQEDTVKIIVSAWSAGPGRVKSVAQGIVPNIKETQNEVKDVLMHWGRLKGVAIGTADVIRSDADAFILKFLEKMSTPGGGVLELPAQSRVTLIKGFIEFFAQTFGSLDKLTPAVKNKLLEFGHSAGVSIQDSMKMSVAGIEKMLEAGQLVSPDALERFYDAQLDRFKDVGSAQFGQKQMKDLGQKQIQAMLQQDFLFEPGMFDQTAAQLMRITERSGLTMTKLYNMLTSGMNPEVMKNILRGNENVTLEFYRNFMSTFERAGRVPTKLYAAWESAIVEMLGIGDDFTEATLRNWAAILKELPVKKLGEDAAAFAKYFTLLAARKDIKTDDLRLMSSLMQQFGASADEIWKAFGDVADQQIRRIRASWYESGSGLKNDLKESATLGDALWWSMTKGVADFASKLRDPFKMLSDTVSGILEQTRSTMEEMFTDLGMRQPKTWQEYQNKFAEGLIKIGAKNMSEQVMSGMTDMMGSAFGMSPETMEKMGLKKSTAAQRTSEDAKKTAASASSIDSTLKSMVPPSERTAAATVSIDTKMGAGSGLGSPGAASGWPASPTPGPGEGAYERVNQETYRKYPELDPLYEKMKKEGIVTGRKTSDERIGSETDTKLTSESSSTSGTSTGASGFSLSNIPIIGPIFSILQSLFSGLGRMIGFRTGGIVPGFGFGDIVPAMLEPGEAVIPRSVVRKYQDGGEASSIDEEALQEMMMQMVDARVSDTLEPLQERMDPLASIGEGNYGPAFERQLAFQDYMDRASAADNQKKLAEWNMNTARDVQAFQSQPTLMGTLMQMGMSTLKMVGSMGGMMALGGLVPHFAVGGPILTTRSESERPWLYANPRTLTIDESDKVPWWQTLYSYTSALLGPAMILTKMFGGKEGGGKFPSGSYEKIGQEKFRLDPSSDPMQGGGSWLDKIGSWFSGSKGASPADATAGAGSGGGGIGGLFGGLGTTGIGDFFSGIGSWFGGLFADGGVVPPWAPKLATGAYATKSGYFPTSGYGSSTAANSTYTTTGTQGSYWPAMIMAMLPLLFMLQKYGLGGDKTKKAETAKPVTPTDVSKTGEEPGFFGNLWTGFKGLFGASSGGLIPHYAGGDLVELLQKKRPDSGKGLIWDMVLEEYGGKASAAWSTVQNYLPDFLNTKQKFPPGWSPEEIAAERAAGMLSPALGGDIAKSRGLPEGHIPDAWKNRGLIEEGYPPIEEALGGLIKGFADGDLVEFLTRSRPDTGKGLIWDEALAQGISGASGVWDWVSSLLGGSGGGFGKAKMSPFNADGTPPDPAEYKAWMKTQGVRKALGGLINMFAVGDQVPGLGNGDTVPAWLTPGEFVVNKGTVGAFSPEFFHGLQGMAKQQKIDSIAHVAGAAHQAQRFAAGGIVKTGPAATTSSAAGGETSGASMSGHAATSPDIKMTMVTVVDDASLDQFLNTKKYGDVLVNKLGSRISRRMSGGRAV
jgi:TP901 family phage tail tape measure protein